MPTTLGEADGELLRDARALRATAGVTVRLGWRLVPTLNLAVGADRLWLVRGAMAEGAVGRGRVPDAAVDLVAAAGLGLDWRLGRRWLVGAPASPRCTRQPLGDGAGYDALEATVHVAAYWYPRWFGFD